MLQAGAAIGRAEHTSVCASTFSEIIEINRSHSLPILFDAKLDKQRVALRDRSWYMTVTPCSGRDATCDENMKSEITLSHTLP